VTIKFLKNILLPILAGIALLGGCYDQGLGPKPPSYAAISYLAQQPLDTVPWEYAGTPGVRITTNHYHVYTTVSDPIYQRLMALTLEAAYDQAKKWVPGAVVAQRMECYVFAQRGTWETYTKQYTGEYAATYLRITAGGYSHRGVFAGFDIGRELTLGMMAHEAWHQFSWLALKDRLPSAYEEALATQFEAITWTGTNPRFESLQNYRRWQQLQKAARANKLWELSRILPTHPGQVITNEAKSVDGYYAQIWALGLWLQEPAQLPALQNMLEDARIGKLTRHLRGSGISQLEIDAYSENWNAAAGLRYTSAYFRGDIGTQEASYRNFTLRVAKDFPPQV